MIDEITPEPELSDIRVYIDNDLIVDVQNDIEKQGILPIPNDDEDYLDYVDALDGGNPEGPFRNVYIDLSQITDDKEIILKGVKFDGNITEFKDFTSVTGNTVSLPNGKSLIYVINSSLKYEIVYRYNNTGSSQTVSVGSYEAYYKMFDSVAHNLYIVDEENNNIFEIYDPPSDTNNSRFHIYKSIFTINFN